MCYLHETTTKNEGMSRIQEKHMILLARKTHLIEEVLWHYELTNKTETG
jgi:hypothetical protein